MLVNQTIIPDIKSIISTSTEKAIRAADNERTIMYWHIGKRIFEEEQEGKDRAGYGEYLTKYISEQLEPEFGSGYSKCQIELIRQFYRTFPIANTLYSQLSWSQYKLLIRIDNKDRKTAARKFNDRHLAVCQKNDGVVKFTLPEDTKNIVASQYELYLPTAQQLLAEINKELENFEENKKDNLS